jgi:hypothetical protein
MTNHYEIPIIKFRSRQKSSGPRGALKTLRNQVTQSIDVLENIYYLITIIFFGFLDFHLLGFSTISPTKPALSFR